MKISKVVPKREFLMKYRVGITAACVMLSACKPPAKGSNKVGVTSGASQGPAATASDCKDFVRSYGLNLVPVTANLSSDLKLNFQCIGSHKFPSSDTFADGNSYQLVLVAPSNKGAGINITYRHKPKADWNTDPVIGTPSPIGNCAQSDDTCSDTGVSNSLAYDLNDLNFEQYQLFGDRSSVTWRSLPAKSGDSMSISIDLVFGNSKSKVALHYLKGDLTAPGTGVHGRQ